MPIRKVENTEMTYYLICFDTEGKERTGDSDGQMSMRVLEMLKTEPISDVLLISHEWLGDIPDAIRQYASSKLTRVTLDAESNYKRIETRLSCIGRQRTMQRHSPRCSQIDGEPGTFSS